MHCRSLLALAMLAFAACSRPDDANVWRRFHAPAARQGVAVAADTFYAIDDRSIEKYDARTGALQLRFDAGGDRTITHLNGCVVVDGVLHCAHSNYPGVPMQSSIERFDAETLAHLGSQPFAAPPGSATWVDRAAGHWWVAFAHYAGRGGEPGRGPEHTRLLKLDDAWRPLAEYRYPPALVARFAGRSNSGGGFGPDGWLYLTGHDAPELYVTCIDEADAALRWLATWRVPLAGQGIAWDHRSRALWGILRARREVLELGLQPGEPLPGPGPRPVICPEGK